MRRAASKQRISDKNAGIVADFDGMCISSVLIGISGGNILRGRCHIPHDGPEPGSQQHIDSATLLHMHLSNHLTDKRADAAVPAWYFDRAASSNLLQ